MLAAGFAGLGAWAAQPPVAATPAAAPLPRMAVLAAPNAAAGQTASLTAPPVSNANPISSGDDRGVSNNVPAVRAVSRAPVRAQMPSADSIEARVEPTPAALPQISQPENRIAPDPSTQPASPEASPEPKASLARNTVGETASAEVAAPAAASAGPSFATEVALGCLLGMGRDGCENLFVGADRNPNQNSGSLSSFDVLRRISNCAGYYIHRALNNCPDGFLETVQYLGRNLDGDDVYLAKFMHMDKTYVISQLTPEGKIQKFWRFDGPPIRVVAYRRLVELRAPAGAPRTIYSREPSVVR